MFEFNSMFLNLTKSSLFMNCSFEDGFENDGSEVRLARLHGARE